MLADGNGEYTAPSASRWTAASFGIGMRGQRFAIVVEDGTATHVAIEAPGKFEVSKAEAILESL